MTRIAHINARTAALTAVLALVGAAGLMTVAATAASAAPATRYVATTGDDTDNDCTDQANPCRTVQYAVDQANAGDTVSIGAGAFHEAVHIRISLTLTGAGSTGAGRTTIDGPSECCDPSIFIDGTDSDSVPEVTVQDLDVSGNAGGPGIRIVEGVGHVNDSVVSDNTDEGIIVASFQPEVKSAVKPADLTIVPSVTVTNSSVDGNGGNENAAGILLDEGLAEVDHSSVSHNASGGVVLEGGTAHISTSTLNGNIGAAFVLDDSTAVGSFTDSTASNTAPFSDNEGPAFGGGILVFFGGTLNVDTSTIANNVGQGVLSESGYVHVNNSTISGTKPSADGMPNGGIVVESQIEATSRAAANRFAGTAGAARPTAGIKPDAVALPGTAIRGTIVADNTTIDDCTGTVQDAGYNLASDGSCDLSATGSIENGHARLGALADNGGPTQTMKPAKASDARDKIPSGVAGCDPAGTDQRGEPRLAGPKCDIGAVELAQPPVLIAPNALPNGTVGATYHQLIHISGGLGSPYTMTISAGSLPPGLALGDDGSIGGVPTQAGTFHFTVSVDDPTLKDYTIVIEAAATEPLANTGPNVRPYAYLGSVAVGLGLLMLAASGALGRWYRRYLRQH